MTVLNQSDIPSDIATVEELLAWVAGLYTDVNPNTEVLEEPNAKLPLSTFTVFTAADGSERVLIRATIEVDPAWKSDKSKKFWKWMQQSSGVAIPAAYKTP